MWRMIGRTAAVVLAAAVLAATTGCGNDKTGGVEPKAPANAPKLEQKGTSGPGAPKMKAE